MISASDSGIDAGAMQPMGIDKQLRVQELTMDHTRPVDMKEVVARIADDSDFPEFGANYGRATVCGHVTLEHWPLGVVTNNGPIY